MVKCTRMKIRRTSSKLHGLHHQRGDSNQFCGAAGRLRSSCSTPADRIRLLTSEAASAANPFASSSSFARSFSGDLDSDTAVSPAFESELRQGQRIRLQRPVQKYAHLLCSTLYLDIASPLSNALVSTCSSSAVVPSPNNGIPSPINSGTRVRCSSCKTPAWRNLRIV